MTDKDRRPPESEDDPDKTVLIRDDDGGARLVPGGNIVEGEMEEDGGETGRVDPELGRDH